MNVNRPDLPDCKTGSPSRPYLTVIEGGLAGIPPSAPPPAPEDGEGWDDLHGWVDGALPSHRSAVVGLALSRDPAVAGRALAYKAQVEGLHALYDPILNEPIPERLLQTLRAAEARPRPTAEGIPVRAAGRRWLSAALAVLGLMVLLAQQILADIPQSLGIVGGGLLP